MLPNLTFLGLPSYQHMFLGAIVVILAVPLLVNLPEARVAVLWHLCSYWPSSGRF